MQLRDNFNIIDNHINQDITIKQQLKSIINQFIENYFITNKIVVLPSLMHQINFNDDIIDYNIIISYLSQSRKNMRNNIKRQTFNFNNLIEFIENTTNKIKYIVSILNLNEINRNIFVNNYLSQLLKYILSDSIISIFIENILISLDFNKKEIISKYFKLMKDIDKENKFFIDFINSIGKNFIINNINIPIPDNLKNIQLLIDNINQYKLVSEYYNFINDNNINNIIIINGIIPAFSKILDLGNIDDIIFICENFGDELFKIIKISENKFNMLKFTTTISNIIMNNNDNILLCIKLLSLYSLYCDIKNIPNNLYKNKLFNDIIIIIEYFNNLVINKKYTMAFNISKLFYLCPDRDILINKYKEYLIKRMIILWKNTNYKELIDFELLIYNNIITKIYNIKESNHIYRIIHNYLDSINMNLKYSSNILNTLIIDHDIWDINMTNGIVNMNQLVNYNSEFSNTLVKYTEFFEKNNKKETLFWSLHYGEIIITYENHKIKMLPIHFMILELFDKKDSIMYNDIINMQFFTTYNEKFRHDILNSLFISNLLNSNNVNQHNIITLNNNKQYKDDIIKIFFNISDYDIVINKRKEHDLIISRKDIINTNINSILKKNKELTKEELYSILIENIKLFVVTNDLFEESLQHLIKMDYIEYNNMKYQKIYY